MTGDDRTPVDPDPDPLHEGDRVQWLDVPGYVCGTVRGPDATGVTVDLDNGLGLHVGEFNIAVSLRRVR